MKSADSYQLSAISYRLSAIGWQAIRTLSRQNFPHGPISAEPNLPGDNFCRGITTSKDFVDFHGNTQISASFKGLAYPLLNGPLA
ncbi:MAG TPA: hypothetical protein VK327_17680 [Candidatus Paceibacterota bacterium]|nr:hypothetical protein [Candidatus Paceibacterota bacterium]